MEQILEQQHEYSYECLEAKITVKLTVQQQQREQASKSAVVLKNKLPAPDRKALELASEKGASNWLTSLPIEEFDFCPHKGAFKDALALRYGWTPSNIPQHAEGCWRECQRGVLLISRYNEIWDVTATLLTEVCHDSQVELDLQPLTGEVLASATSVKT